MVLCLMEQVWMLVRLGQPCWALVGEEVRWLAGWAEQMLCLGQEEERQECRQAGSMQELRAR